MKIIILDTETTGGGQGDRICQLSCKFHFYVSSHFTFMFPPISLKVSTWKQGVK